jgi:hypothetical protein
VVLDPWQDVAISVADRSPPVACVDVVRHTGYLASPDAPVDRLSGTHVVVAMGERTPFPAEVPARLPRLRLLVTGGTADAASDGAPIRVLTAG